MKNKDGRVARKMQLYSSLLTDSVSTLNLLLRHRQVVPLFLPLLRLDCAPHDAQLTRNVVDGRTPQLRGNS